MPNNAATNNRNLRWKKYMIKKTLLRALYRQQLGAAKLQANTQWRSFGPNVFIGPASQAEHLLVQEFAWVAAQAQEKLVLKYLNKAKTHAAVKRLLAIAAISLDPDSEFYMNQMKKKTGKRVARAATRAYLNPHTELGKRRLAHEFERFEQEVHNYKRARVQ